MGQQRQAALERGDLNEEIRDTCWGKVLLTEMSAEVRFRLASRAVAKAKEQQPATEFDPDEVFPADLLRCILDPETREPLFEREDLPRLVARNRRTLQECDEVIGRLSAASPEALEEAKRRFFEIQRARSSSSEPNGSTEPSASS